MKYPPPMRHISINSALPFPPSRHSRAVYSWRKYFPITDRIITGDSRLWSRSASTEAALSKSLAARASVILNTTASTLGTAKASISSRVTLSWGQ